MLLLVLLLQLPLPGLLILTIVADGSRFRNAMNTKLFISHNELFVQSSPPRYLHDFTIQYSFRDPLDHIHCSLQRQDHKPLFTACCNGTSFLLLFLFLISSIHHHHPCRASPSAVSDHRPVVTGCWHFSGVSTLLLKQTLIYSVFPIIAIYVVLGLISDFVYNWLTTLS